MDNKVYLQEAFKALDMLNEEDFNLDTLSGQEDFTEFQIEDEQKPDFIDIMDVEAVEEEDIKDSYIGKLILDCCVCHNKFYKDREEIDFDEDSEVVNAEEECPYCYSTDGFKIIGMVAPFEEKEEEEEIEVEDEPDGEVEDEDEKIEEGFSSIRKGKLKEANLAEDSHSIDEEDADFFRNLLGPDFSVTLEDDGRHSVEMIITFDNNKYFSGQIESTDEFDQIVADYFSRQHKDSEVIGNNNGTKIWLRKSRAKNESLNDSVCPNCGKTPCECDIDEACNKNEACGYKRFQKNTKEDLTESADISEYQKWVDYDMKKYGKISKLTMSKIKNAGFSVVKDQYGDYEVIADRKDESLKEDFERVEIETDREKMEMTADDEGKVTVTTEPKSEVVAPVSDNIQSELNPVEEEEPEDEAEPEEDIDFEEEDIDIDSDIDDFSEDEFDELGESYLKKIYENVNSYKTISVNNRNNKLIVEGIIKFNSGNQKKTSFIFEAASVKGKTVKFIGENAQITRGRKAFTITGNVNNGKFITESFNYNYRTKDSKGNPTRIYGTLKNESLNEADELSKKSNSLSNLLIKNKDKIDSATSKEELISVLQSILKDNGGQKAKSVIEIAKSKRNFEQALQYVYNFILKGDNLGSIDKRTVANRRDVKA